MVKYLSMAEKKLSNPRNFAGAGVPQSFNLNEISKFYNSLRISNNYTKFANLSIEKQIVIDQIVEEYRCHYERNGLKIRVGEILMAYTAERLNVNSSFSHLTDDEKAYFFIKMVDPNFKHLEDYKQKKKEFGKVKKSDYPNQNIRNLILLENCFDLNAPKNEYQNILEDDEGLKR